jgi:hypothetical protein
MTLQTIPGGLWIPAYPSDVDGVATLGDLTLDAVGEKMGIVFQIPKDGEVSDICFLTSTISGGDFTFDVRLETVAADGTPSGTLKDTNANASQAILNADDDTWFETTLTASATVTRGVSVAIVLNMTVDSGTTTKFKRFNDERELHAAYVLLDTGGGWVKQANTVRGAVAVKYDDGSYEYVPGLWPITTVGTDTFNNTDTPDHIGIRFQLPFPARVSGCWVWVDPDGDFDVILVDSDGDATSPLATATLDKDHVISAGTVSIAKLLFDATPTLSKDTNYWLAVRPSSATDLSIYNWTVNSAGIMDCFEGGQNWQYSTGKDPAGTGDWTTVATKRMWMGLILDQFDDGAGGGGASILGGGNLAGGFA